jgi:2-polyprenyl-6-methoxyphenol hydroxylase-like FAD-dependent oxidoreductase
MSTHAADLLIVGAGPVGLLSAYLAQLCGMSTVIVDKSDGPLEVGRADALNARTLQLLQVAGLFDELYPLGKICNTSSVWSKGKFISRQSAWWQEIEGCFHKHFLMLGQSHVEKLLEKKLTELNTKVRRQTSVQDIKLIENGCLSTLSTGEIIQSSYVIGADGSHSFVRDHFDVSFNVVRPQLIWAVIDGIVDTDFSKVPEIISFQNDTSDVAWIPREGEIDRFYIRMDTKDFVLEDALTKIQTALTPHKFSFKEIAWFSQFSVKEGVAEKYSVHDRIFLAGDACHIHSVNGGQGLNTGLADAFNLIWKLNMVKNHGAPAELLQTYEAERRPVALSVVETSGELVRSTKFSETGTHAEDYVKIVQKRAGNVTGMGIRYGDQGLRGQRLHDLLVQHGGEEKRIYSHLDYTKFTLFIFGAAEMEWSLPEKINVIHIRETKSPYANLAILVRPDSYIESATPLEDITELWGNIW